MRILPSVASCNQFNIEKELERIKGYNYLHFDIEDGNFLPNITFGVKTIKSIMDNSSFECDLHLLTKNNKLFLNELKGYHFSHICFHIESSMYPLEEIKIIKESGAKVGLAFNLKTKIEDALIFKDDIDYLLIMTSESDNEGCLFKNSAIEKVREARRLFPNKEIWVDGGINEKALALLITSGVDVAVMGRAIWKTDDPIKKINELLKEQGEYYV